EEAYTYSKAGEVVRYPSIPPGDYTFEFVGVDKNGRNTEPFTLPVSISPPFYQTWWFWTLCGTAFIGLFYTLNRRAIQKETIRQQAIQKEEARKADEKLARHQAVVSEQRRIMMELHDDLGGTLGSLFYTLDGYLLDQESGFPVTPDLELLKNTSSDAMKQLREVMKNNVARELPLPIFVRTLTEQARAVAQASKLTWKLERDDVFPEIKLSGRQVHNALLIAKEALQNIRKHAKATSFVLRVQLEGEASETMSIQLTDDGVGMKENNDDQRTDGTGNGLINMRRRAEDLGGILIVEHPSEGGTSLQLRFPLEE
ncbi:MAG: sensor histidine kinase, partial [Lewinella sp.]